MADSSSSSSSAAGAAAIQISCKVMVNKMVGGSEIKVKGEILATRTVADDKVQYYIHYCEYNKRLDEWVGLDRLNLDTLEAPAPKKLPGTPEQGTPTSQQQQQQQQQSSHTKASGSSGTKASGSNSASASGSSSSSSARKRPLSKKAQLSKAKQMQQTHASGKENDTNRANDGGSGAFPRTPSKLESMSTPRSQSNMDDDGNNNEDDGDAGGDTGDANSSSGSSSSSSSAANATPGGSGSMGEGDKDDKSLAIIDPATGDVISKEQELANLRLGGSMTSRLEEVARVKNINRIEIGKFIVDTWYFSPYPEEMAASDTIFICEFCLGYNKSKRTLARHRTKCNLRHPPGNEIYRSGNISFFELDGHKQKLYCRNLCLLSKLFLDHKTLYYDVDPFLFYIMTENDATGCHILGYFSKEKKSALDYNVACILTLPQHQRKGYGKLLIAFSYELSKREKKKGSPEKPLSDLGYLSYQSFWAEELIRILLEMREVSIDDLANMTSITHEDIISTLTNLEVLVYYKGKHIFKLSDKVISDYNRSIKKQTNRIDPNCIRWEPPVFSAAQLKFI